MRAVSTACSGSYCPPSFASSSCIALEKRSDTSLSPPFSRAPSHPTTASAECSIARAAALPQPRSPTEIRSAIGTAIESRASRSALSVAARVASSTELRTTCSVRSPAKRITKSDVNFAARSPSSGGCSSSLTSTTRLCCAL